MDFQEKFVAFVDILGFKSMVETAEKGEGRSTSEILEILSALEREKDRDFYTHDGPMVCPDSAYMQKDLNFEITQISDCVIVSAEISPAGAINIISHCWAVAASLLRKGIILRGYITRGPVIHKGNLLLGTGYQRAFQREREVSAFRVEAEEKGTPFIEVDPTVRSYIQDECDECVQSVFSRLVKADDDLTALFPFTALTNLSSIDGFSLDVEREKSKSDITRQAIVLLKDKVRQYVHSKDEAANKKVRHYIAALDTQIKFCDEFDEEIDFLGQPISEPMGVYKKVRIVDIR